MATRTTSAAPTSRLDPGFGQWLRGTRAGVPMHLSELAAAAGLAQGTVRDLELSKRLEGEFNIEIFVRLAKVLNIDLGYLLHKAGFDIGRDGLNLTRLRRVESAMGAFLEHEAQLRYTLSVALSALGEDDVLARDLGRGLGALDLVSERLRREGFVASVQHELEADGGASRPWTDADREFLLRNPALSHEDAARHLNRSVAAVRAVRVRNKNGVSQ